MIYFTCTQENLSIKVKKKKHVKKTIFYSIEACTCTFKKTFFLYQPKTFFLLFPHL